MKSPKGIIHPQFLAEREVKLPKYAIPRVVLGSGMSVFSHCVPAEARLRTFLFFGGGGGNLVGNLAGILRDFLCTTSRHEI